MIKMVEKVYALRVEEGKKFRGNEALFNYIYTVLGTDTSPI